MPTLSIEYAVERGLALGDELNGTGMPCNEPENRLTELRSRTSM